MRSCHACSQPAAPAARFCGSCGALLEEAVILPHEPARHIPVPVPEYAAGSGSPLERTDVLRLRRHLEELRSALAAAELPAPVVEAVRIAATGPGTEAPTTVILGEARRGKTTLVNRLLRRELLSTRSRDPAEPVLPVRVSVGPEWRATLEPPGELTGPPFAAPEGHVLREVEGPAELLRLTTLIDAPPPGPAEAETGDVSLRLALAAGLVIVCLSADMLLSETERALVRQRLLPFTGSPVLLAVNRTDRLQPSETGSEPIAGAADEESERAEVEKRLAQFLRRLPPGRVRGLFLPPGKDASQPVPELEALVREEMERAGCHREQAWSGRVRVLLETVARVAAELPDPEEPAPALREDPVAVRERWEASLEREHRLALRAAEARLRSRMAALRLAVPDRVALLQPERLRHEGLLELTAEVQAVGQEAAGSYLDCLRDGLSGVGAPELRGAGEALGAGALGPAQRASAAPALGQRAPRPRDMRPVALTALGALLIVSGGSLYPVLGGLLAVYGAHQVRRTRREEFLARLRADAATALQEWLVEVEAEFVRGLRDSAGKVAEKLRERLAELSPPPALPDVPTAPRVSARAEILACLDRCISACAALESGEDRV